MASTSAMSRGSIMATFAPRAGANSPFFEHPIPAETPGLIDSTAAGPPWLHTATSV